MYESSILLYLVRAADAAVCRRRFRARAAASGRRCEAGRGQRRGPC
jgi:hypothetical protein